MKVKRLIYASSCSVYGDHGKKLVNEKDELRPLTVYALSKFSSENEILKMNDKYFNVICLRFATLFGYSPRMRFDLGVNLMAKKIICNKNIIINGDGKQYRSFVHVNDVAKTLTFIADLKNNFKNNIYNVGSNKNNIKIIDLAKKLKKLFPEIKVVFEKDNKDFRSYRVDFLRLKKIININKFLSIEDGVIDVFSKFKDKNSKDLEDKKYYNLKTLKS
jgi:nucleoside-diphosphate-sugar epimerase